jgi:DNA-directed RNA polymerase subunit alpha
MNRVIPDIRLLETQSNETEGTFSYAPLAPGYAITLGNSLRRVLLSSMPGFSIRAVAIDGVNHKFTCLPGMKEDVIHFIQNLKLVRFKFTSEAIDKVRFRLEANGPCEVRSSMIKTYTEDLSDSVIILDDLYLCSLNQDGKIKCDIFVERGTGYVDTVDSGDSVQPGRIAINSVPNAVKKVTVNTENIRYGEHTDYEVLHLSIHTDGSISPSDALAKASKILCEQFSVISDSFQASKFGSKQKGARQANQADLLRPVSDIGLSEKTVAALHEFGIKTVGDLVNCTESYLFGIPRFGRRKIQDIQAALAPLRLALKDASIVLTEKDT